MISTNRSFPFDPALSVLNLEVEATDHGTPPLAQTVPVLIEVSLWERLDSEFDRLMFPGIFLFTPYGGSSAVSFLCVASAVE